jgi:hypothetical protein
MITKQNTTKTLRENKLLLRMQGWKDTLSYKHISVLFWQRYTAFGITHFTHFVTSTVLNMKRNTVCWRRINECTMFRRPIVKNTKLWRPINIHTTFLRPINKSTKFRRPINNQTHQQKHNILETDQQNTSFVNRSIKTHRFEDRPTRTQRLEDLSTRNRRFGNRSFPRHVLFCLIRDVENCP